MKDNAHLPKVLHFEIGGFTGPCHEVLWILLILLLLLPLLLLRHLLLLPLLHQRHLRHFGSHQS